jgi:hypothetical protein
MNIRTRSISFLLLAILALIISACKPRIVIGPEQIFSVDVPRPENNSAMDVMLDIAVPQGTLTLGGGTESLIQGGITYNAAEYEPQMTNGNGALLIHQSAPGPKSVVVTTQNNLVNKWDLQLGDAPMNLQIRLESGDYHLEFNKSLPANIEVTVNAAVGVVYLTIEPGLAAQVTIGETTSLLKVTTRGEWTQDGDVYQTGTGSPTLTITVNMPGADLTLDSK